MRVLGPALLAVGLVAVPAVAAPGDNQSHSTVAVTDRVTKVAVSLDRGNVTVRRGRAGSVDITKTWQGQEPTVTVKVDKGVLSVASHCPGLVDGPFLYVGTPLGTCVTSVVVTLPSTSLDATVDTYGGVSVADLKGSLDLSSGTGAVSVSKTSGPTLSISTNGGAVAVRDGVAGTLAVSTGTANASLERVTVSGKATVDSNGGSLQLTSLRAGSLATSSGTGDQTLDHVTTAGATSVDSNGGAARVTTLRASSLTQSTGTGDQSLSDVVLSSPLKLNSNGGAVTVSNVKVPDLRISSGTGDVRLRSVRTPTIGVDTNGGAIDVAESDAVTYDLASGTGGVALVTHKTPTAVKVATNGGRVDVTVPRGSYGLVVSQNGGRLTIDGITLDARSGHSLDLTSGSGNITVLGR